VIATNSSALLVASVTVAVDITVTCTIATTIPRDPRRVQEVRSGTAIVQQLRPGTSGRAPLPIAAGICPEFATWSAVYRIGETRIGSDN
jgi:hypothetical protein